MKEYTLGTFILDLILGACTGGLWWVYRVIKILVGLSNNKS